MADVYETIAGKAAGELDVPDLEKSRPELLPAVGWIQIGIDNHPECTQTDPGADGKIGEETFHTRAARKLYVKDVFIVDTPGIAQMAKDLSVLLPFDEQ